MKRRGHRRMIRGQWWRIVFVPAREIPGHGKEADAGRRLLGLTDFEARTIYVADHLRGKTLVKTIAHEWGHAEEPDADHRKVYRQSEQLADVLEIARRRGHA